MPIELRPATQATLNAALRRTWGPPTCDREEAVYAEVGVELAPSCHPQSGLRAQYRDGELSVTCKRCRGHVIQIAVAQERPYAP